MKAVILAAGMGSRLGQGDLPKPLTQLANGKSMLARTLDILSHYLPLMDVMVVVGYHKAHIMQAFPQVQFVDNPEFATENTAKSLLHALEMCHEDLLWINGDVVFHPAVIQTILANPRTSMVVNKGPVGEEEIKYRQDDSGRILEVSKKVSAPQGEAPGINYCSASDLPLLRAKLMACAPTDYFEKAIEECIKAGMQVWSVCVDATFCVEVDFPADLARANRLIKTWEQK